MLIKQQWWQIIALKFKILGSHTFILIYDSTFKGRTKLTDQTINLRLHLSCFAERIASTGVNQYTL